MAEPPLLPPPLPPQKKHKVWPIVLAVGAGIAFLAAIAVFVAGSVVLATKSRERAAQRTQAIVDLEKASYQARQNAEDDLIKDHGVESTARIREQLEKSAAMLGGSDAIAYRALSETLRTLQDRQKAYQATADNVSDAAVLSGSIIDRTEIAQKRTIVQEFLLENDHLEEAYRRSSETLGSELDKNKVPDAVKRQVISSYKETQVKSLPLLTRIRKCDRVIGENLLAALALYETNWGHWRIETSGELHFDNRAAGKQFNEIAAKVEAVADDQAAAQSEWIAILKSDPSGAPAAAAPPRPGP